MREKQKKYGQNLYMAAVTELCSFESPLRFIFE